MRLRFCNQCDKLSPKESEQTKKKEPHICKYLNRRLRHEGHHPDIPTPKDCDYVRPEGARHEQDMDNAE